MKNEKQVAKEMRIVYLITLLTILYIGVFAYVDSRAHKQPVDDAAQTKIFSMIEIFSTLEPTPIPTAMETLGPIQKTTFKIIPESKPEPPPELEAIPETISEPKLETVSTEIDPSNIEALYAEIIPYIAKTVWGEARGCSVMEQAAVIWCILNRVDSELAYMPDDIISVIIQIDGHGHFHFRGYNPDFPVTDEIYELVVDVLARWELEKTGVEGVGRVLPKEYLYFHGDGERNHFRDEYSGGNVWDWSLPNPYID